MIKKTLASLAFGLAGCMTSPLAVGRTVPAFHVKAHDGSDLSPDRFRGKWVVYWFYPKADTPG